MHPSWQVCSAPTAAKHLSVQKDTCVLCVMVSATASCHRRFACPLCHACSCCCCGCSGSDCPAGSACELAVRCPCRVGCPGCCPGCCACCAAKVLHAQSSVRPAPPGRGCSCPICWAKAKHVTFTQPSMRSALCLQHPPRVPSLSCRLIQHLGQVPTQNLLVTPVATPVTATDGRQQHQTAGGAVGPGLRVQQQATTPGAGFFREVCRQRRLQLL